MSETQTYGALLVLSLAACSSGGSSETDRQPIETDPPWSYAGDTGPRHWSDLDPDYETCERGHAQSPIDLTKSIDATVPHVSVDYGESGTSVENTGRTIHYDYDTGSTLRLGDHSYELLQFHFHAHSEHSVDGKHAPMELHLVHQDAAGQLLVLAVLIQEGAENPAFEELSWEALPEEPGDVFESEEKRFNASALVPGGPSYRYQGSLTTPPCTEPVTWLVFQTPLTLSRAQIAEFTALYPDNARPVQPLSGRTVSFGE